MEWTKIEDQKSRRRVGKEWKQRPAVCGSDVVGSVNLCGGVSVEAVWCVRRSECPRRFPGWMVVWVWLSLVRPVSRRTHVVLTSAYLGREVCREGKGSACGHRWDMVLRSGLSVTHWEINDLWCTGREICFITTPWIYCTKIQLSKTFPEMSQMSHARVNQYLLIFITSRFGASWGGLLLKGSAPKHSTCCIPPQWRKTRSCPQCEIINYCQDAIHSLMDNTI